MEFRQLRTFLAVIEYGGFRRAATRLYLSQPAVTQQIADLERSLGTALFVRGPAGAVPTAAGLAFAPAAQRVLDEADEAARSVRRQRLAGCLTLGICPGGAAELTRALLVELRRLPPQVEITTRDLPLLPWTGGPPAGTDLAILRDPVLADQTRTTPLFSEPVMVAVPQNWPVKEAERLTPAELFSLPLVRFAADVPRPLADFWSLARHRDGAEVEFRGAGAYSLQTAAAGVISGRAAALTTAAVVRHVPCYMPIIELSCRATTTVWLVSRIDDRRPLLETVHHETARISERLTPLLVPGVIEPGEAHDPGKMVG